MYCMCVVYGVYVLVCGCFCELVCTHFLTKHFPCNFVVVAVVVVDENYSNLDSLGPLLKRISYCVQLE